MSETATSANVRYPRVSWLPGSASQQGAYAVAIGAALWGLFWIPLRYLDDIGVSGLWAIALVMLALALPCIVILYRAKQLNSLKSTNAWVVGTTIGLATVLYFTGVIFSDVIRVVFLFYLLPIWTSISARLLYKEPITRSRLVIIALALTGLWLLLGGGSALPIPSNIGDWCGLIAGMCWGVSLSVLRGTEEADASTVLCTTAICATLIAAVVGFILISLGFSSPPQTDSWWIAIGLAVFFACVFLLPSYIGQIWGAQRIAAPTAALLTMTEILVATVSAYFLIGTTLNTIALVGAGIILCAVLIDIYLQFKQA